MRHMPSDDRHPGSPVRRPVRRTGRRLIVGAVLAMTLGGTVVGAPGTAGAAPIVAPSLDEANRAELDAATVALARRALELLPRTDLVALRSTDDVTAFAQTRDELATLVAGRVGVEPARMIAAWTAADRPHQIALFTALTEVGTPYRRNSSRPGVAFDCSGITTYAWAAAGVDLPRQSTQQIRVAAPRTPDNAQAGDLIQYPGHVMMWLGVDNTIVHARQRGRWVEIDTFKRTKVRFGDPTGTPAPAEA